MAYEKVSKPQVIPDWLSPDLGTPDYYHRCSGEEVGIPRNWAGIAEPIHGDAYLGIYLWRITGYRENLVVALNRPLMKDSTYWVGCFIKHAIKSEFSYQTIDLGLTDQMPMIDPHTMVMLEATGITMTITPQTNRGWSLVKMEYKAIGGERFFAIGNFLKKGRVDTISSAYIHLMEKEPQLMKASYYYLDSAFVVPKFPVTPTTMVFGDMNFAFDHWELNTNATWRLDSLCEGIEAMNFFLEVEGHTDNTGTHEYNMSLSERRARSIAQHIIECGWPRERLKVMAYGDTQPLVDNSSEENRSQNRRVVIRLVQ